MSHAFEKNCSRDAITSPPPNSIASGLASGYAPDVFTCLNSVELALISRARVNQQRIFSFSGGSHTKVSVYHCLQHYYKCNESSRIGNFMSLLAISKNTENKLIGFYSDLPILFLGDFCQL